MAVKVRVSAFGVSADGFGAGVNQRLDKPFGDNADGIMSWFLPTRTFRSQIGQEGGETGVDDDFARRSMEGVGCWILGRNMFAASRGPWIDDGWKGWWGEEPPYHCPTIILTHHPRDPIGMKSGTTFHFETGGIERALQRARAFAGDRDVRIGGGAQTVRQYLEAGLVDEMHVAVAPTLVGTGSPLWQGLDLPGLGYRISDSVQGERAQHLTIRRAS